MIFPKKKKWKHIFFFGIFLMVIFSMMFQFGSYNSKMEMGTRISYKCGRKSQPRYDEKGFERIKDVQDCAALERINIAYQKEIRPIFQRNCLTCHNAAERLTHYGGNSQESSIRKGNLNARKMGRAMTFDFSFLGKGSIFDDLSAIKKVMEKRSMPPWQYKLMHWRLGPTEKERQRILSWVENSFEELRSSPRVESND